MKVSWKKNTKRKKGVMNKYHYGETPQHNEHCFYYTENPYHDKNESKDKVDSFRNNLNLEDYFEEDVLYSFNKGKRWELKEKMENATGDRNEDIVCMKAIDNIWGSTKRTIDGIDIKILKGEIEKKERKEKQKQKNQKRKRRKGKKERYNPPIKTRKSIKKSLIQEENSKNNDKNGNKLKKKKKNCCHK